MWRGAVSYAEMMSVEMITYSNNGGDNDGERRTFAIINTVCKIVVCIFVVLMTVIIVFC